MIGAALFAALLAANLPTPLYQVYEHRFGFSRAVLTLIFATYAVVLIPSLLLFGQLSDRIGRRLPIALGLVVAAGGLALFALARGTPWLFAARAVQGIAVGIISGTATAASVELEPRGDQTRAAFVASIAQAAGAAGGPVLAGVPALAQAAGLLTLVAGLVALVAAFPARLLALLLTAAVLAGAGLGLGTVGAQTEINGLAPQRRRGEVTAAYITCVYSGVTVTSVAAGLLSGVVSLFAAVAIVAAVVAAVAATVALWHMRTRSVHSGL